MTFDRALRRFRDDSAPSPDAIERVRRRARAEAGPVLSPAELRAATAPAPGAETRVWERVIAAREIDAASPPRSWLPIPLLIGAAAAAGAGVWLYGTADAPSLPEALPEPPEIAAAPPSEPAAAPPRRRPARTDAAAAPMAMALASTQAEATLAPFPDVRLAYRGTGRLSGTAAAPRIDWDDGRLAVEVTPGRGIDLVVSTTEADVRVVGTGFTVHRDAFGTEVTVHHGTVEVTCAGSAPKRLTKGGAGVCFPHTASGLLARARAQLHERDANGALASIDAGLAVAADGAETDELRLLQLEVLISEGRDVSALLDALIASPRTCDRARRLAADGGAAVPDGACPIR